MCIINWTASCGFSKYFLNVTCMSVLPAHMSVHHMCGECPRRPGEGPGAHGTAVTGGCEPPRGCLELNWGSAAKAASAPDYWAASQAAFHSFVFFKPNLLPYPDPLIRIYTAKALSQNSLAPSSSASHVARDKTWHLISSLGMHAHTCTHVHTHVHTKNM